MAPRISMCICTMNRPAELTACISSIMASSVKPHQIIVSDDSRGARTEETRRVAEAFAGVTYVPGPRRGLSANRNSCLDHVTGDVVCFVDDDSVLGPGFLEAGLREHEKSLRAHPDGKFILSGILVTPEATTVPVNVSFLGFYTRALKEGEKLNAVCMGTALFPAALFREVRFDENIVYGADERDISLEAIARGYEIVHSDDLVVHHYPSPINRDEYQAVVEIARFYFCLKRYWFYERSLPKFLLYNVYGPLNAFGSRIRRLRLRESIVVLGAFLRAWRLFSLKLRERRT